MGERANGPTAFSSDAEHWLRANTQAVAKSERTAGWETVYELDRCASAIVDGGYQRVGASFGW